MKVAIFLADGFEETEFIAPTDILRRAGLDTVTVSLKEGPVKGAHGITIAADLFINNADLSEFGAVVCPGGLPGSDNLYNDERVISFVKEVVASGGVAGAICAAPRVLAKAGVLDNKKATCYPGTEELFSESTIYQDKNIVIDGRVITAKGAGLSLEFGYALVSLLQSESVAEKLRKGMFYPC